MASLRGDQLETLTGFLGYGNPSGRFWFMGRRVYGQGSSSQASQISGSLMPSRRLVLTRVDDPGRRLCCRPMAPPAPEAGPSVHRLSLSVSRFPPS